LAKGVDTATTLAGGGVSGFYDLQAVHVILTAGCNLRCAYCYQNRKRQLSMDWDTARAAVDLLFRSRRRELSLTLLGGEPLKEFDLFRKVVDYAAAARPPGKRLQFFTSTNGVLLDGAKAAFLVAHDVRTNLSFDGVPASQMLRAPATFPILDRLLNRLRREHPGFYRRRLKVCLTVVGANVPVLADSVRYFLRKGIETIAVSPRVDHDPDWKTEGITLLDQEFSRVFRTCLRHYRDTGEVPLVLFRRGPERVRPPRRRRAMCSVGSGRALTVDIDGQVYGCVTFARSYQVLPAGLLGECPALMPLGEVHDPSLAERFDRYASIVERATIFNDKQGKYSSYGQCRTCRYFDSCGVCPMSIGYSSGNSDPARVPDLPCAWNLISGKYRDRFPRRPRGFEWIQGGAPLPERIRALLALGASR